MRIASIVRRAVAIYVVVNAHVASGDGPQTAVS